AADARLSPVSASGIVGMVLVDRGDEHRVRIVAHPEPGRQRRLDRYGDAGGVFPPGRPVRASTSVRRLDWAFRMEFYDGRALSRGGQRTAAGIARLPLC